MPTYEFRNNSTGEIFDQSMSISELDRFLEANPMIERYHSSAPQLVYSGGTGLKPTNNFRDRLADIKKNNIHSNVNTF